MRRATATPHHVFWPDDLSITSREWFRDSRFLGPKQITDIYLLALAVEHGGRLLTMDGRIHAGAVEGASEEHLVVL